MSLNRITLRNLVITIIGLLRILLWILLLWIWWLSKRLLIWLLIYWLISLWISLHSLSLKGRLILITWLTVLLDRLALIRNLFLVSWLTILRRKISWLTCNWKLLISHNSIINCCCIIIILITHCQFIIFIKMSKCAQIYYNTNYK